MSYPPNIPVQIIRSAVLCTVCFIAMIFLIRDVRAIDSGGAAHIKNLYNLPRELLDRLYMIIDRRYIEEGKKDIQITELIKKFRRLEALLEEESNDNHIFQLIMERLNSGDLEGAERLMKRELERDLRIVRERRRLSAVVGNELEAIKNNQLEGAERALLMTLVRNRRIINKERRDAASVAFFIGSLRELQLDYKGARRYLETAVRLEPEDRRYLSGLWSVLALSGKRSNNLEELNRALEIGLKIFGKEHRNIASLYNNIGLAWNSSGNYKRAVEYLNKSLEIGLKVHGRFHPDIATNYNNLGEVWRSLGEYKKAIECLKMAVEIGLAVNGDKHPGIVASYNNLGETWRALGEYGKSIEYFMKALDVGLKVYGQKHQNVAIIYNNIGLALESSGKGEKALEYYRKAVDIFTLTLGEDHPLTRTARSNLESFRRNKTVPDKS
jgi:tetratricopeptide (TPR) repeat protein